MIVNRLFVNKIFIDTLVIGVVECPKIFLTCNGRVIMSFKNLVIILINSVIVLISNNADTRHAVNRK